MSRLRRHHRLKPLTNQESSSSCRGHGSISFHTYLPCHLSSSYFSNFPPSLPPSNPSTKIWSPLKSTTPPSPPIPIPSISVPTFIFTSGTPSSRQQPQYFDADQPSKNFGLTQAEILVKRIALGLQNLGLKPDEKVLLYAGNSLWFPVLLWGVIASRCVFSGCSPGASVSELAYQLRDSDARVLLCSAGVADKARQAAREVGLDEGMVFEFCDPANTALSSDMKLWTSFWADESIARIWKWREFSNATEAQTTTAVLNYSSGTTGLPKGVLISHYNLISNSLQVLHKRNMIADTPAAKARAARLAMSGERWLAPLPMFHAYGQAYYCMSAAVSGTKVFIMPSYEINRYLTYLDAYRITFLTGVPTLMTSLAKIAPEGLKLNAIESVVTGSAPLDPAVGRMVEQKLLKEGVNVKQGWGMTESTCSATGFAPDDVDDGRSIGWINPNVSCKIVPVEGREFAAESGIPFAIGEIWISGPNIMIGYYKKEAATRETIAYEDGMRWLKTGDIGYVDDRGCIYIIDRLKELIKVKGLQVAPAEVEGTLLQHPGVLDAAVVGYKMRDGEYPKAYVVKKQPEVTAEELQKFVASKLSKHKWLTAGVEFIDVVPRTASGKVIRRALPQKDATENSKL